MAKTKYEEILENLIRKMIIDLNYDQSKYYERFLFDKYIENKKQFFGITKNRYEKLTKTYLYTGDDQLVKDLRNEVIEFYKDRFKMVNFSIDEYLYKHLDNAVRLAFRRALYEPSIIEAVAWMELTSIKGEKFTKIRGFGEKRTEKIMKVYDERIKKDIEFKSLISDIRVYAEIYITNDDERHITDIIDEFIEIYDYNVK